MEWISSRLTKCLSQRVYSKSTTYRNVFRWRICRFWKLEVTTRFYSIIRWKKVKRIFSILARIFRNYQTIVTKKGKTLDNQLGLHSFSLCIWNPGNLLNGSRIDSWKLGWCSYRSGSCSAFSDILTQRNWHWELRSKLRERCAQAMWRKEMNVENLLWSMSQKTKKPFLLFENLPNRKVSIRIRFMYLHLGRYIKGCLWAHIIFKHNIYPISICTFLYLGQAIHEQTWFQFELLTNLNFCTVSWLLKKLQHTV